MSDQGFADLPASLVLDGLGCSAMDHHPDRVMEVWVLGTLERGRMALRIGDQERDLRPGHYYLLPPGIRHCGLSHAAYEVTFWHFRCVAGPPCYRLPWFGAIPTDLDTLQILRAAERMRHRSDDWRWIAVQLEALVARLCSSNRSVDEGEGAKTAGAVLGWLLEHRDRPWDRVALERRFGYSYRYLNRLFHGRFHQAIRARHLELRVQLAGDLITGGASLKQAAQQAGFSDYFNFLRRFRQVQGMTAGRFQKGGRTVP